MSPIETEQARVQARTESLLIGHGIVVIVVALIAGLMLAFHLVGGIKLWPLLDIDMTFAGSERGWRGAHNGGLANGILLIIIALTLSKITLTVSQLRWVFWLFIGTAWGNTVFYWFGNFSSNRGLAATDTVLGEADLYGIIAYIVVAPAMFMTFAGCWILARQAFRGARAS